MVKPVILLAFANEMGDENRYLRNLPNEQNCLRKALEKAEDSDLCELVILANVTLDQLVETFQRKKYRDRIALFHYGGHAGSYELLLEQANGVNTQLAHGEGLVPFLAAQKGLKAVFLNGCFSAKQAQDLVDRGIPVAFGTVQAVNDKIATNLAKHFYRALSEGTTLEEAWKQATHLLTASEGVANLNAYYEQDSKSGGSRDFYQREQRDQFPWEIYCRPGLEDTLGWNLPEAANDPYFGLPDLVEKLDLPDQPYRFLERYSQKDARIFFGRGTYIRDLYHRLTSSYTAPCILFCGQSGVGKSSLLEAGLFPRLEENYDIKYIRRDPQVGLLRHLQNMLGAETDLLQHWKQKENQSSKNGLVLIVDQVEEVFTRPNADQPQELAVFFQAVAALFSTIENRPQGKLLLSYRKEYDLEIEKASRVVGLPTEKVFLDRLDRNGIMEVINGLASTSAHRNKYRVEIEKNLAILIADDLLVDRNSPISPVLQIIMTRMWQDQEEKDQRHFRVDAYSDLLKKGIFLDDFFQQQMASLRNWEKSMTNQAESSGLALDILHHHTTPLGTAESRSLEELAGLYQHRSEVLQQLIQQFQQLYLLTGLGENRSALAHDTLAPIVQKAINESDKPGQRAYRILSAKIMDYELNPTTTYLDEEDLKLVEAGVSGMRLWTSQEKALIEKSQQRRTKLEQLKKVKKRIQIAFEIGIAVFAILASLFWYQSKKQAAENALMAEVNRLVSEARRVERTDATQAYDIIANAIELMPNNQNALQARHDIYSENEFYYRTFQTEKKLVDEYDYSVESVAYSSDAKLIAAAIGNRVLLWNEEGQLQQTFPHNKKVNLVQFGPDDQQVFTVGNDHQPRFWNLNGSPAMELSIEGNSSVTGNISEDGSMITGGNDGMVYLWRATGKAAHSWQAHTDSITFVLASNDRVISGSWNKELSFWKWDGQKEKLQTTASHSARPITADYHPTTNTVLVGYRDGTLRWWTLDGRLQKETKAHTRRINQIAFSPDGQSFLTASSDYQVKLWSLDGDLIKTYKGHDNFVNTIAFTADREYFISGDEDGKVNCWKRESKVSQKLQLESVGVECMAISATGPTVLIGSGIRDLSRDGLALEQELAYPLLVWDYESGSQTPIANHQAPIHDVAIAADGQSYLSGDEDGKLVMWSPQGTIISQETIGFNVLSLAFLPDNKGFVTAVQTGKEAQKSRVTFWDQKRNATGYLPFNFWVYNLAIWPDPAQYELLIVGDDNQDGSAAIFREGADAVDSLGFPGHKFRSAVFSPDGTYFALGESGKNAQLHLFQAHPPKQLKFAQEARLEGDNVEGGRAITAIAFSKDNRYVLAGAEGGLVKLFLLDLETGWQEILTLDDFAGHDVTDVAFSPDEKWMIIASRDGAVRCYKNI